MLVGLLFLQRRMMVVLLFLTRRMSASSAKEDLEEYNNKRFQTPILENPVSAIHKTSCRLIIPGDVSNTPKTSGCTQANCAHNDLTMQLGASGSGASKRQGDQSSAKESADSRSVDTRKTLLTEDEYKTRAYLECRLSELRVRKTETEQKISALYTTMIDSLMKDVDDFKSRVQNADHDGASRQYFLEECSKFQRELQTSLTKQQEYYSTATKKLKVADPHEAQAVPSKDPHEAKAVPSKDQHEAQAVPSKNQHEAKAVPSKNQHEAKAVPSRDQHVYTRPGQAAGVIPVESMEAHGNDLPTGVDRDSIDLLLIGNCGNGKSATGNSILGRPAFRRTASSSVDASSIKMESTEFFGKVVNVIDGPSISVSGNITPEEVGNIIENVSKSLELCKFSFTALLIILKFGERFTKQEIEALRVIRAVLGKDVVREYGVCVITYGDSFEYAKEEARESGEEMTFEGWLKEQKGEVTNLFKECNNRCVLFDNVTKDVTKRQTQLDKLMDILPKGKRYSRDAFLQACEGTQDLEMEASLPTFLKEAQAEADKIRELIDQHEEIKKNDPEASNIKLKLHELKEKVNKMRTSSNELESLKMSLYVLESNLNMKLQRWQLEREMEMNRGAKGTTSARSPTPALTDQTTMTIYKTPYDSHGTDFNRDMAQPLHVNRDIYTPSEFNRDMPAPSNSNRDMSASLGFNTSNNKPSSSVDNSSHAFSSNTGTTQGSPFNDNLTTATQQMHDTGMTDQHPDTSVNIKSFVVVDKEMVTGESRASMALNNQSIITRRVKAFFTSS